MGTKNEPNGGPERNLMDISPLDGTTVHTIDVPIPAAKMHVLALAPLKRKLDGRWERLSDLVHKLFEKAITNVQTPADHFVVLDELSYVVTFSNLTLAQTNLICASIAKEVCEELFGDQIDEVSVRSLVCEIISPSSIDAAHAGVQIEAILERSGIESVTTQSVQSGSSKPIVSITEERQKQFSAYEQIRDAHSLFESFGLRLELHPIWELRKGICYSLLLTPVSGKSPLSGLTDAQIIDIEISQLFAASAYSARVHDQHKMCAVGVGVTYDSLSCFRFRIKYITALQQVAFSPSNPLLIKIERVPEGAPESRLCELIAMLRTQNVRVTVEYRSLNSIPDMSLRLGAAGIGGALPPGISGASARAIIEKLARRAAAQKAFAFLDHLDTRERVGLAYEMNIRFGTGPALSIRHFSGLEAVPEFPLILADNR